MMVIFKENPISMSLINRIILFCGTCLLLYNPGFTEGETLALYRQMKWELFLANP